MVDVIKNIIIRGSAEGIDQLNKKIAELASGMEGVAVASSKQEKAAISAEQSLKRLENRYDQTAKAQRDLAKVQSDLDKARAQGLITQQRQADLMQLAIKYHNSATGAAKLHAVAIQELTSNLSGMASRLGSVGSLLASLGSIGLAVAAALAAVAGAAGIAAHESLKLAETAGQLRDFSETTGFTVAQLQALQIEAAQVGVSSESLTRGLERFSVAFDDLSKGTGAAFQSLRQIDPELAGQIARAKSLSDAFELYSEALDKAEISQRNLSARQIFGRGGIELTRVTAAVQAAGGIDGLIKKMNELEIITGRQAEAWDDAGDKINENLRLIRQNLASTFAEPVLDAMVKITNGLREMSILIKGGDWESSWLVFFAGWVKYLIPTVGPMMALADAVKAIRGQFGGQQAPPPPTTSPLEGPIPLPTPRPNAVIKATEETERLKKETILAANESARLMNIIGATATPAEQLANKILQLNKAQAEGDLTAEQLAQATARLNREFESDAARRNAAAIGEAATESEKLNEKIRQLEEQFRKGEISSEAMTRGVQGLKDEAVISHLERQVQVLGDAATESEKFEAAVARLQFQLDKGQITQDTFNRKVLELIPIFKDLSSRISSFLDTFIQGMVEGKSVTDSLAASLKQLGAAITSSIVKDIGANIAKSIAGGIGGSAAGGSIGSLFGAGGAAAGGTAVAEGIGGGVGGAAATGASLGAFGGPVGIAAGLAIAVGISLLGKALDKSGKEAEDAAKAQQILAYQQQQAAAQAEALANAQREATAAAAEAMRIADEQARREIERQVEIGRRREDLMDRIVRASLHGDDSLQAQLILFEREADKQRNEEAARGGENLAYLEQALALERANIVKDFNDKMIEEEKRAAKERADAIKSASQDIVRYLQGLLTGPEGGLSPFRRLQEAQRLYNEQLKLAQAGDIDALRTITQFAESYRAAARAFFGSSIGYQNALRTIQGDLGTVAATAKQSGGMIVGGIPGMDSVPILGTPGEFVVRAQVAQRNLAQLSELNRTGVWHGAGANDNYVMAMERLNQNVVFMLAHLTRRIAGLEDAFVRALALQTRELNSQTRLAEQDPRKKVA